MRGASILALLLLGQLLAWPTAAQTAEPLAALQRQDVRLARIAEAMLTANSQLCRQLMPVTGMIVHSRDQYGEDGAPLFASGLIAIAAVLAGSPAERAGLMPGDGILAIGGDELADLQPPAEGPLRDSVFDILARQPPEGALGLRVARGEREFAVSMEPQAGCLALVEIVAGEERAARSDGRVIQLGYGLAADMSDDGLAAIFAHEMAHLVLEHRRRLSEAGVSKGLFGEFGASGRRNREAEIEADRMSVHLLANAGLDPQIAPRFWLSPEGRGVDAGIFRSSIYPSPSRRAEIMQREVAELLPPGHGPSWPEHLLALRESAF